MKTIETIANVDREGKLIVEFASDLPPGTHRAVLVIDEASSAQTETSDRVDQLPEEGKTAWDALRSHAGSVDMPEDWAKEHDHYLYGTPKRQA